MITETYDDISPITGNKCVIEEANEHDNTVSYLCMESGFASHENLINESKQPFRTIEDLHELRKQQGILFDNVMDYETDCFCKAN